MRSISSRYLKLTNKNRYILTLILIHTSVMVALLVAVIVLGYDYHDILLVDDGYYTSAGQIVQGEPLNTWFGLGYPAILTVLYVFPKFLHPFIRLLLSLLFTYGTIALVFRIFKNYLSDKEIFLGGIVFVINPLYLHWMFKSRIEAPLILLLGLIILFSQKFLRDGKWFHSLIAALFLGISVFTKPVFMLVPSFLLLFSVFFKSLRTLLLSVILFVIAAGSFYGTKMIVRRPARGSDYYQVYGIVGSAFYVDLIVRNRDFRAQPAYIIDENGDFVRNPMFAPGDDWSAKYKQKYGNLNPIMMSIRLTYERPFMILQQLILNPFFAFCLSGTEAETGFHFVVNSVMIILAVCGIIKIRNRTTILCIHITIILAVYALLVLVHSRAPYFLPIMPYLFVFAGKQLHSFLSSIGFITNNR